MPLPPSGTKKMALFWPKMFNLAQLAFEAVSVFLTKGDTFEPEANSVYY